MSFILLAAVDVADGRVARFDGGDPGAEPGPTNPLEAARRWIADGADWIHLVDLDAAFGRGSNAELLASVVADLDARVELSGGIDDGRALDRALATGCDRAVLSTAALADPAWCSDAIAAHGDRIAVALDVRITTGADGSAQHRLTPRGGAGDRGDLWETMARLDGDGCARYIVTDVSRDGMLNGPNLDLHRAISGVTATPVIASGGVASIDDLVALAEAARTGVNIEGSVVGKALNSGRFTMTEACRAVRQVDSPGVFGGRIKVVEVEPGDVP